MARPTRQQRRARREARAAAGEPKPAQRTRARQQLEMTEAARPQPVHREPTERFRFIRESWGELQKVDWPGRNQVITGTVVVIIACAIVGTYLWLADIALKNLVEDLILRGA